MTETEIKPRDYAGVSTAQIVEEMLTENTGLSLCDSGGTYGRNWQGNQGKASSDQPVLTCTWDTSRREGQQYGRPEMQAKISLYHWMANCLEFDVEMQARLDSYATTEEAEGVTWLDVQEGFAEHESQRYGRARAPNTINTCNNPNNWGCSQDLQYVELYLEGMHESSHLIVSVHGGCDERGGYTSPKCFKLCYDHHDALDKARVSGISAGPFWWDFRRGEIEQVHEDAPTQDPWREPCYDISWLAGDTPELGPLLASIQRFTAERNTLPQHLRIADVLHAAERQVDDVIQLVRAEVHRIVVALLGERHGVCTFVDDERLFLVHTPDGATGPLAQEVTAYNDL